MVLESQLSMTEGLLQQLKPCVEVAKLIESTSIKFENNKRLSLFKCNKIREELFLAALGKIWNLEIDPDVKSQMVAHCELHQFTTQTLTDSEFESHFILSGVGYGHKERLRQHNKQCLVLFMNSYKDLLHRIFILKELELTNGEILTNAGWLNAMIARHQETRKFFPFCKDCQHHTEERCAFWADVSSKITSALSLNDVNPDVPKLQEYFVELEIECPCPASTEDLIAKWGWK